MHASVLKFALVFFVLSVAHVTAHEQNKLIPHTSKNSAGVFLEQGKFIAKESNIDYFVNGRRYDANLSVSKKYGIYNSYAIYPFLHSYSKLSYQYVNIHYADVNLEEGYALIEKNGLDSLDVKGNSDNHRITCELGIESRLSLYSSLWNGTPTFDALLVVNGGILFGKNLMQNSYFEGSIIYGYDYGLSLRFELFDHFYMTTGFDWYHNYSRAYGKTGSNSKDNSLMLDLDQSGRIVFGTGAMF